MCALIELEWVEWESDTRRVRRISCKSAAGKRGCGGGVVERDRERERERER